MVQTGIGAWLAELFGELPALLLLGPRAAGKTTTASRHAAEIVRLDRGDPAHLISLRDELGKTFLAGAVLHTGPGLFVLSERIFAVPIAALWG